MIRLDYVSAGEVAEELNSIEDESEKIELLKIWDMMTTCNEGQPEQDGGALGLVRLQSLVAARESVLKKQKLQEKYAQRRNKKA